MKSAINIEIKNIVKLEMLEAVHTYCVLIECNEIENIIINKRE